MFGFFNKKKLETYAPITGKIIDITEVSDQVFSTKMMGDGFAIEPETDVVVAPCDGTVTLVAATKHAVAIESQGVQILIHIGLDTVDLQGQGFTAHVKENDVVKKGTPLITFDRDYIVAQEKPLTTMMVITNMDEKVKTIEKNLADGMGPILAIEVK
ncbi:PTS sugar transporter subunit IIA [Anaerosinus massiliensis]|uniref:PTS sugar transporter subunit IIA n=1 Tax=Massilibacillus massiliensis TaxID=1806837 RepID=UPI000DA5FB63|nr:PTS glucose transporter subunit IIA [Massilibacillus massiliensis]